MKRNVKMNDRRLPCHRFHSITTQYYRKADGILVMYDVTQATSYMAVRDWLAQVQVRPICHANQPF